MAYTCSICTTYVSNVRIEISYVVNLKAFPLFYAISMWRKRATDQKFKATDRDRVRSDHEKTKMGHKCLPFCICDYVFA